MNLIEGQQYMLQKTQELASNEYSKQVKVAFNNARCEIGTCTPYIMKNIIIKYSNRIIELNQKEDLIYLIIHEVAHIKYPNHKKVFKNECRKIAKNLGIVFNDNGYKRKIPLNQYNYIYRCTNCGYKMGRVRPFKSIMLHTSCYKELKKQGDVYANKNSRYVSI